MAAKKVGRSGATANKQTRAVGRMERPAAPAKTAKPARRAIKAAALKKRAVPKKRAAPKQQDMAQKIEHRKNVVPDSIDLRDRPYMPSVQVIPAAYVPPPLYIPMLNQGETNACTGFALASVIYHLQYKANPETAQPVSPYMLYSMARRYDEFPGNPKLDTGSSLRGAMKGWFKYGACAAELWKTEKMPPPNPDMAKDWWQDAVIRPLGAYYRLDIKSVADMQVALNEIGALYASAVCHSGWGEGEKPQTTAKIWAIPYAKATSADGAHAFAIVGYTEEGFIIHNSWDTGWGSGGRAILTYDDWREHGMDCWVAQLGVRSSLRAEIADSPSIRWKAGRVQLAADKTLRNRELDPFIIDMENNGRLSNTGDFRTQDDDVVALLNHHLGEARSRWGLGDKDPVDIAIYAHGGLTSEDVAANTAEFWVKPLYDNRIFPIFLMWETDLWSILKDIGEDQKAPVERTTGTMWDGIKNFWNERLEKLLSVPGTRVWGEMKQNADAISGLAQSGGRKLYAASLKSPYFQDKSKVRLHLIGHSAGAIVHSYIIDRLKEWTFATVSFMAPAVRVDMFEDLVVPALKDRIGQYNQFELSDAAELKDMTCEKLLGYTRSLLYLVSQSFEKDEQTKKIPILGMNIYSGFLKQVGNTKIFDAPGQFSQSMTHGGFDNDEATRDAIINLIRTGKP